MRRNHIQQESKIRADRDLVRGSGSEWDRRMDPPPVPRMGRELVLGRGKHHPDNRIRHRGSGARGEIGRDFDGESDVAAS